MRFCSLPLVPLVGESIVTTSSLSSHSTVTTQGVLLCKNKVIIIIIPCKVFWTQALKEQKIIPMYCSFFEAINEQPHASVTMQYATVQLIARCTTRLQLMYDCPENITANNINNYRNEPFGVTDAVRVFTELYYQIVPILRMQLCIFLFPFHSYKKWNIINNYVLMCCCDC